MKHHYFSLLLTLLLCMVETNASATEETFVDGIYYIFSGSTATVTSGDQSASFWYRGHIDIPETVNYGGKDYYVTAIEDAAFGRCEKLQEIGIPRTVSSISPGAFLFCSSLHTISVAANNPTYYSNDFNAIIERGTNILIAGCQSTTIPQGVTSIGDYAFAGCSRLDGIDIPNSVTRIGDYAFQDCSMAALDIPSSVTSIGGGAFYRCTSLEYVDIPEGVTSIGPYAFDKCDALTSVILPSSLKTMSSYTFGSTYLQYIFCLATTPIAIDEITFSNRANATLYVPSSALSQYRADDKWNGFGTIYGLSAVPVGNLTYALDVQNRTATVVASETGYTGQVYIPRTIDVGGIEFGVNSIHNNAFRNCTGLTKIRICGSSYDKGVTSIPAGAFYGCTGLTDVVIDSGVAEIGASAFEGCTSLSKVLFNSTASVNGYNSVTTIGNSAFARCTNLVAISLPNGLTTLGSSVFSGCTQLSYIRIPSGVTSIPDNLFNACFNLGSVTIPSTVKSIGSQAFIYCHNLTDIVIPEGVTSIGSNAFYECTGLSSVSIPSSMKSIGSGAFADCSRLTEVTVGMDTPLAIDWSTFSNRANATLYVPYGTKKAYMEAEYWQDFKAFVDNSCVIDGIVYVLDEGVAIVSPKQEEPVYAGDIVIPASIEFNGTTYRVTSIADAAFAYSDVTSVFIPGSVKDIGFGAFFLCSSLTSVTISEGVETIGNLAFAGSSLTSVTIPYTVTSIGTNAFNSCTALTSVTVDIDNPLTIDKNTFSDRANATLTVPYGRSAAYEGATYWTDFKEIQEMPNYIIVDGIAYRPERNSGGIKSMTVVKTDANYAGDINIAASVVYRGQSYPVTRIDQNAFKDCASLYSIAIPNSVTWKILEGAFCGCDDLGTIIVAEDNPVYDSRDNCNAIIETSTNTLIAGCKNSTVPEGVKSIAEWAFCEIYNLKSIALPSSMISIGEGAFASCISLSSVNIPEGVTTIGEGAFMDCPLTSIIIPSSVTSIKDWAFSCPKLISVTVNREKPLAIDGTVFSNRANATLYVPYGCKDAYEAAKYWTDFMEIVEMPGPNILTIDESGFATYCSGQALDFTTVKDVKAYVATGFNFNKETLQLTQVTKVQAGEGLFISGKPGTYEIPECTTSIGYYNILQGVLSATSITPTSDGYSRFIFTDGEYGKFFYPISVPTDLAAGTAYLQLPTGVLPDDLTVIGLDLDGTVGVGEVESEELRMKNEKWAGAVYSLDGRPIAPSTSVNGTLPKGIYVRGGRKVVIK